MVDFSQALHVVNGGAAGTLRFTLRLRRDQVLSNEDPLSVGPAPGTTDLAIWRSVRERFLRDMDLDWPDFSFDDCAEDGLLSNAGRLIEEKTVAAWVGLGLPDQLFLAWLAFLFDRQNVPLSKLRVIQFETLLPRQKVLSMGELRPEDITGWQPAPRPLTSGEVEELRRAWKVYTSDDPAVLSTYLAGSSPMPSLHRALGRLLYRYPDSRSGLGLWDERLLHHCLRKAPSAIRVVAETMADSCETLDLLGDTYLFHRLVGMANARTPLVSLTGNRRVARECEVALTPFGRRVLLGEANNVHENGIDDWIGGVHLTDRTVVFRDGDSLLLPS